MHHKLIDHINHIHPTIRTTGFITLKIGVAFLVLMVLVRKIQLDQLTRAISQADMVFIVAAILLLAPNLYFQFAKWRLVVWRENSTVRNRHIVFSLLVSLALGFVTPGRIGDASRTFFIKNVDWARLLGLLTIDKLITLAVLYLTGIIGLSRFISMRMHPFVWLPIFIMTIGLVLLFLLFLLRPEMLRSLVARYHRLLSRHGAVDKFLTGIEMATPRLTFDLLVLSVLLTFTYCSQLVLLVLAFEKMPVLGGYLSTFAVMFTKSLLPISLGDLGIRESASVYFFGHYGVTGAAAFNASFLLFLINILTPSVMGLVLLLFKRQNLILSYGKSVAG